MTALLKRHWPIVIMVSVGLILFTNDEHYAAWALLGGWLIGWVEGGMQAYRNLEELRKVR